jgi:hypothetical protein
VIGIHCVVVEQAASKAKTFIDKVPSGMVVIVRPDGKKAVTNTSVKPDKSVQVVQLIPVQVCSFTLVIDPPTVPRDTLAVIAIQRIICFYSI